VITVITAIIHSEERKEGRKKERKKKIPGR
jgi:hypothetical protein